MLVLFSSILLATCSEVTPNTQIDEFTAGISSFAKKFYQECAQSTVGNMLVSPFSATMALSLISQASDGITFDELRNGLHLSDANATLADRFHQYYVSLEKNARKSELMVANRLYVQQGFQLKPSFQEVAAVKLFSGAETVDFTKANITAEMINKFVKEKTNERIKEIVKPDMFVDHHYRAVLINAISMKGTWVKPFPVIRKRNFYINETAFVERDFMMVSQYFWSIRMNELDARAIRLDYANSNFSFVLILPNNRTGLHALESQTTNYTLSQIIDRMIYFKCIIHMPKFKIESSISLKEILKKMSMVSMFDRTANLSGLSDSEEPLYVDDIIHKTTIEIDEKHTETGRSIRTLEAAFSFEVSHPFIYHIWDRATNTTIFSGHIKNF